MINLLFISGSPRAELLRGHFQQRLRIRCDVVTDYDHGLKDVFEKRPAAVCIQDQIAGVTGESVARHIQLLLGSSAPSFILLHDGNPKVRAVPGLFSHLVDLSGPFDDVCSAFENALQALMGSKWEQALIEQPAPPVQPPVAAAPPAALSAADELVDSFIADLSGKSQASLATLEQLASGKRPPVHSFDDLIEYDAQGGPPAEPIEPVKPAAPVDPVPPLSPESVAVKNPPAAVAPLETQGKGPARKPVASPAAATSRSPIATNQAKPPQSANVTPPPPVQLPAESDELTEEELLLMFDQHAGASGASRLRLLLLAFLLGAILFALLYLAMSWSSSMRSLERPPSSPPKPVSLPQTHPPVSSSRGAQTPLKGGNGPKLPSFVPAAGLDPAFARTAPGWNRYRGKGREYRLFTVDGNLQALQVLVTGQDPVATSELKGALTELFGTSSYIVSKQEPGDGMLIERAFIPGHGDLLIYRSQKDGPIKAFVVSVNRP